jgi:ERCC4-related helicase
VTTHFGITDYHAKLLAHELSCRQSPGSVERFVGALSDAQVDLNPHQIDAALFAFRNPFSNGAILADEVGLGKTIEAGLVLSQKWAERRRRLLVIMPANLRKQWSQELDDKFHLPSIILEARSFTADINNAKSNPFEQLEIVLCSFQFAMSKERYIRAIDWDLVVVDESHRLRNVYKSTSRMARKIKSAIGHSPKLLLTATPLQNSLRELYGLVSIIDEFTFGDLKSFNKRFARPANKEDFDELKERLKPVCKRTLRRQVSEYINYTERRAIVQEFQPLPEEQHLYDQVTEYLQRDTLFALPDGQRHLMTSLLRKLLASSTFAIAPTLEGLALRLKRNAGGTRHVGEAVHNGDCDRDAFQEAVEECAEDEDAPVLGRGEYAPEQMADVKEEAEILRRLGRLARSVESNAKSGTLLTALRTGFSAAADAQRKQGAAKLIDKAVVFTESRRTQDYLFDELQKTEFAGQVVLFNGSNADQLSRHIYDRWLDRNAGTDRITGSPGANMRVALIEHFRDEAKILLATDAAAEGINLQFCNLVINYDLPWNPQRVEQRIGRCHRYGQKYDVVVVNFLNVQNAVDVRVHQLLRDKFKLFDGVFGASDEVLGAVEASVSFEKRIAGIYQKCRTTQEIEAAFDAYQRELESKIAATRDIARLQLLDNFDQDVIEKVRIESHAALDRFEAWLWTLTRHRLGEFATFDEGNHRFELKTNPFLELPLKLGLYRMGKAETDANIYRAGHPLAQRIIEEALKTVTPTTELTFNLTTGGRNISILRPYIGKRGTLRIDKLTVKSIEEEDALLLAAETDDGVELQPDECRRLFDLPASVTGFGAIPARAELDAMILKRRQAVLDRLNDRNKGWFEAEMDKLDKWAHDRRMSLRSGLDQLDNDIKAVRNALRSSRMASEKVQLRRQIWRLEHKREQAWKEYDKVVRAVIDKKERMLNGVAARLNTSFQQETLFTIRWRIA